MRFSQRIASYPKKSFLSLIFAALFLAAVPQVLFAQGDVSLWGSVTQWIQSAKKDQTRLNKDGCLGGSSRFRFMWIFKF